MSKLDEMIDERENLGGAAPATIRLFREVSRRLGDEKPLTPTQPVAEAEQEIASQIIRSVNGSWPQDSVQIGIVVDFLRQFSSFHLAGVKKERDELIRRLSETLGGPVQEFDLLLASERTAQETIVRLRRELSSRLKEQGEAQPPTEPILQKNTDGPTLTQSQIQELETWVNHYFNEHATARDRGCFRAGYAFGFRSPSPATETPQQSDEEAAKNYHTTSEAFEKIEERAFAAGCSHVRQQLQSAVKAAKIEILKTAISKLISQAPGEAQSFGIIVDLKNEVKK